MQKSTNVIRYWIINRFLIAVVVVTCITHDRTGNIIFIVMFLFTVTFFNYLDSNVSMERMGLIFGV